MRLFLTLLFIIPPSFLVMAKNSILREGDWIKIGVVESGIYKIDKNFFNEINFSDKDIDPFKIQIFGSGYNGALPQLNSLSEFINPQEVPVSFYGNNDSKFDDGEFIFFYLQSSDKIFYDSIQQKVRTKKNIYTDTAYYFLTINNNISKVVGIGDNYDSYEITRDSFLINYRYESDLYTIIQSGREWFGELFSPGNSLDIDISQFNKNTVLDIEINLASRSTEESSFQISLDNQTYNVPMGQVNEGIYGYKLSETVKSFNFFYENSNTFELSYSGGKSSISYLNYVDFTGDINLNYADEDIIFYNKPLHKDLISKQIVNSVNDYNYDSKSKLGLRVWDITDPYDIAELNLRKENSFYYFLQNEKNYRRNIIFDINNLSTPKFFGNVVNSNILNHENPDLLIITHKDFLQDAVRVESLRSKEGLVVKIVDIEDIYNQFSSGNQDISSIRNYIKFLYNTSNKNLSYVLLFGDCSYDYKDRIPNNTNFIPIYQSYNSSNNIYSYSSDDYFGFLDSNEGIWDETVDGDHDLEVGIGRIPSKNKEESKSYVDKLYVYSEKKLIRGDWKKNIYLVADDGDKSVHQNDAENHFNLVNTINPEYKINKIYLDNYEQDIVSGFKTSTQTKYLLSEAVENGAMIVNYIGHGNEFFWTEEKILDDNFIFNLNNRSKLPLFLTATCEFGKFDDPLITSGGEMLLNKDKGGAIALLTTTRPVFSQTNYRLNNQFYKNVFTSETGEYLRLGEIFKKTKNGSLSGPINRNFALLGDPSLKLSYPSFDVRVSKIDTIKSGAKILVSGEIVDQNNDKIENFNGNIYSDVYDKISKNLTLGDENDPYEFLEWDAIIFKGLSSVLNGSFSFEFKIPANIDYKFGQGKINLFAVDTINFDEAIGFSYFTIGGTSDEYQNDNDGPEVDIFLDSYNFISGDRVSESPLLIVDLYDKNGINITEKNTLNTMKAIIDDSIEIKLSRYFSYKKDDYESGSVRVPLENLKNGKHKVEIKVTDNYNNLTSESVVFITGNDNKLNISGVMNYPNPFTDKTNFKFELQERGQPIFISVEVFDLRGHKVFSYQHEYEFSPDNIDNISWDGKDLNYNPLPQGIYIYKLHVRNLMNGKMITLHDKILKIL